MRGHGRAVDRLIAVCVAVYAALSVAETLAGVGCTVIVFGELVHVWDLL